MALGSAAEQRGEVVSQVAVGEAVGQETKDHQGHEHRLGGGMVEAQAGSALAIDDDRATDPVLGGGSGGEVAADSLHAEEASVGGEADLPLGGQVVQPADRRRWRRWRPPPS
jgi:hypothetical protein